MGELEFYYGAKSYVFFPMCGIFLSKWFLPSLFLMLHWAVPCDLLPQEVQPQPLHHPARTETPHVFIYLGKNNFCPCRPKTHSSHIYAFLQNKDKRGQLRRCLLLKLNYAKIFKRVQFSHKLPALMRPEFLLTVFWSQWAGWTLWPSGSW